jgi:hypothetical protein
LAQRRQRRDDDLRPLGAEIREQRHPGTAIRRRLERADRLVARPQQGDGLRFLLAEKVRQVGEGPLGDIRRRDDDEQLSPECPVQPGEQIRPRRRGRFVQAEGVPAPLDDGRPQALDQLGKGSAAGWEGTDETWREGGDDREPSGRDDRVGRGLILPHALDSAVLALY